MARSARRFARCVRVKKKVAPMKRISLVYAAESSLSNNFPLLSIYYHLFSIVHLRIPSGQIYSHSIKPNNWFSCSSMAKVIKVVEKEMLDGELMSVIREAYHAPENAKEEIFFVGVSGGSLPSMLIRVFKQMNDIDWKKWLFFFCDERCVPSSSDESTFGTFKRLLEPPDERLPLCLSQFVTIDPSLKASKIAEDYLSKVRQRFDNASNMPRFHMLFLGLGPDGHTCSLFPNHRLLKETGKWISYLTDSPKPPPERITMTFPVLNNAKYCVFVATGEGKAQVIKEILEDKKQLPAALVQPHSGKLVWLMDKAAGSKLSESVAES